MATPPRSRPLNDGNDLVIIVFSVNEQTFETIHKTAFLFNTIMCEQPEEVGSMGSSSRS